MSKSWDRQSKVFDRSVSNAQKMSAFIHNSFGFFCHAHKTLLCIKTFSETTWKIREYILRITFYNFNKFFAILVVYLLVANLICHVCHLF